MRQFILVCLLVVGIGAGRGQTTSPLPSYIRVALENNLALRQKQTDFERAGRALKIVRAMYGPSLTLDARYTRAGGGRTLDFPIGDLLNPVYGSLNSIFDALGQPEQNFPVLENEHIPFLRREEQDTKLRLIQPLFQPALWHAANARQAQKMQQRAALNSFKNTLIRDVSLAYYDYLQSVQVVEIYREALKVARQAVKTGESLVANGVALSSVTYQAGAEEARVRQQLSRARHNRQLAAMHLNVLLNREPGDSIQIVWPDPVTIPVGDVRTLTRQALKNREEFRMVRQARKAFTAQAAVHEAAFLPQINLVADYGFEGTKYRFTMKDEYWMATLSLQWNLYNSGMDEAKKEEALLAARQLEYREQELERYIALEVEKEYSGLIHAQHVLLAARKEWRGADKAFRILRRQFKTGAVAYIDYLEGRRQWIAARLNLNMAEIAVPAARVRLDAATGQLLYRYSRKESVK